MWQGTHIHIQVDQHLNGASRVEHGSDVQRSASIVAGRVDGLHGVEQRRGLSLLLLLLLACVVLAILVTQPSLYIGTDELQFWQPTAKASCLAAMDTPKKAFALPLIFLLKSNFMKLYH